MNQIQININKTIKELSFLMNECQIFQRQYQECNHNLTKQQDKIKSQANQTSIQLDEMIESLIPIINQTDARNVKELYQSKNKVIKESIQRINSIDYLYYIKRIRFFYQHNEMKQKEIEQQKENDELENEIEKEFASSIQSEDNTLNFFQNNENHQFKQKFLSLDPSDFEAPDYNNLRKKLTITKKQRNYTDYTHYYPLPFDHLYWNYLKHIIEQISTFEQFKYFVCSLLQKQPHEFVYSPKNINLFEKEILPFLIQNLLETTFQTLEQRPRFLKVISITDISRRKVLYLLTCSLFALNEIFKEDFIVEDYSDMMKSMKDYQSIALFFFKKTPKAHALLDGLFNYFELVQNGTISLDEDVYYNIIPADKNFDQLNIENDPNSTNYFHTFDICTNQKYQDFNLNEIQTIPIKKYIWENLFSDEMNIQTEFFIVSPESFILLFLFQESKEFEYIKLGKDYPNNVTHFLKVNSFSYSTNDSNELIINVTKNETPQPYQTQILLYSQYELNETLPQEEQKLYLQSEIMINRKMGYNRNDTSFVFLFGIDQEEKRKTDVLLNYLISSYCNRILHINSLFVMNENDPLIEDMKLLQTFFNEYQINYPLIKSFFNEIMKTKRETFITVEEIIKWILNQL